MRREAVAGHLLPSLSKRLGLGEQRERGDLWAAYLVVWLVRSVVGQEVPAGDGVNHSFSIVIQ